MQRGTNVGGVVGAIVFLSTMAACGPDATPPPRDPNAKETPPPPAQPICRGTQKKVVDTCGCNPIDARLMVRLDATKFTQNQRAEVSDCLDGKADLDVVKSSIFKLNFEGCLKTKVSLDATMRNTVTELVSKAADDAKDDAKSWHETCADIVYKHLAECGDHPCPQTTSKFQGAWTGELSGMAAQPKGLKLIGGIQLAVNQDGATQGDYNVCATAFPSLVVTGRIKGKVSEAGSFEGTYDYAGEHPIQLTGTVARDPSTNEITASLSAATADNLKPTDLRVDTFHVNARNAIAAIPEPCSAARQVKQAGPSATSQTPQMPGPSITRPVLPARLAPVDQSTPSDVKRPAGQ